jgi:GT2 family glycosyltransferase
LPSVSVIVPAYNAAPFIGATLGSICAQTYADFEIIVVNDGSSDTEALERAVAPYIGRIVYLTQPNGGAGAARNRGVKAATGEFLAFLDADDLWRRDFLREQMSFLDEGGYDLVYADALLFGDDAFAGRRFMDSSPSTGAVTFISLVEATCNVITSGVLARRHRVEAAGMFDEDKSISEDFDLWLRMARNGARIGYNRRILLDHRVRKGSMSSDAVGLVEREIAALRKVRGMFELTQVERTAIEQRLSLLSIILDLEKGKRHLIHGQTQEAHNILSSVSHRRPSFKLWVIVQLLGTWPALGTVVARSWLKRPWYVQVKKKRLRNDLVTVAYMGAIAAFVSLMAFVYDAYDLADGFGTAMESSPMSNLVKPPKSD